MTKAALLVALIVAALGMTSVLVSLRELVGAFEAVGTRVHGVSHELFKLNDQLSRLQKDRGLNVDVRRMP